MADIATAPAPTLAELKAKLAAAKKARDEELNKDWDEYAGNIVKKLFGEFPDLKRYLDKMASSAEQRGWVMTPVARRRQLFRVLTGNRKFIAEAVRRAKNAPVQGLASELGVTAAYLVLREMDKYHRLFDEPTDPYHFYQYQRAVHDANYAMTTYATCLPALHVNQWCATYGVTDYYREVFGLTFSIEPELEIDVGASDDAMNTWDWRVSELPGLYLKSLNQQKELGTITEAEVAPAFAQIMEPWVNAKKREYLQTNYPLLGLHRDTPEGENVMRRILEAVRAAGFKPEKAK